MRLPDRPPRGTSSCASLRLAGSGWSRLPAAFTAEKRNAEFAQFALQGGRARRPRPTVAMIEMRARPRASPGADAEFDVGDARARRTRQTVRGGGSLGSSKPNKRRSSSATAFLIHAEIEKFSTSRRACSTVVCTGAWPGRGGVEGAQLPRGRLPRSWRGSRSVSECVRRTVAAASTRAGGVGRWRRYGEGKVSSMMRSVQ